VDDLLTVMLEARRLIALPENDFTWSSFIDQEAALEEIDGFIDELAPFYCPACDRSYCGEHWNATDVFEDGVHDSIRGTCPEGHERLLED